MKIFHTADLHIGKTALGFSLHKDQEFILDRIYDLIEAEKPNVLIIAGDVFDKQVPPVEAVAMFDRFLTKTAAAGTVVFIIAGNHDSPERLSFGGGLMERGGVYIASVPKIVTLTDEFGDVDFYLLPFVKPALARHLYPDKHIESYSDAVAAVLEDLTTKNTKSTKKRRVLAAHQFFAGLGYNPVLSESENVAVGGVDAVELNLIKGFDYAALGHLHGPQSAGDQNIRYAGSPLKYSFSECSHVKSIVKIVLKEQAKVSLLPIPSLRDMRKIKGPIESIISNEIVNSAAPNDYLHVTLTDEGEVLDAMDKLRVYYPNIMALAFENSRTAAADNVPDLFDAEGQGNISSFDLFADFFEARNNSSLTPEQENIIKHFFEDEI